MFCTSCGTSLPDNAKFCGVCGERQDDPRANRVRATASMRRDRSLVAGAAGACRACGSDNAPGQRWCAICHTSLVDVSSGRLASPGKRLGAFILDGLIPVWLLIFGIILIASSSGSDTGSSASGLVVILAFFAYAIWAIVLFAKGTTPGKRLLGMRVIKESGETAGFGTMLFREWIGKWISGLLLSLGFFAILWDKDNQGWHDKLASTYVVTR